MNGVKYYIHIKLKSYKFEFFGKLIVEHLIMCGKAVAMEWVVQ